MSRITQWKKSVAGLWLDVSTTVENPTKTQPCTGWQQLPVLTRFRESHNNNNKTRRLSGLSSGPVLAWHSKNGLTDPTQSLRLHNNVCWNRSSCRRYAPRLWSGSCRSTAGRPQPPGQTPRKRCRVTAAQGGPVGGRGSSGGGSDCRESRCWEPDGFQGGLERRRRKWERRRRRRRRNQGFHCRNGWAIIDIILVIIRIEIVSYLETILQSNII